MWWKQGVLGAAVLLCASCGGTPAPPADAVIVWKDVGEWSGRGLLQTSPFENDTGILRLEWNARSVAPPDNGTFRVSLHSAVSGRRLSVPVDHRGAGRGTVYINEDPRGFYLVIESGDLAWTVDLDEGIPGKRAARQ